MMLFKYVNYVPEKKHTIALDKLGIFLFILRTITNKQCLTQYYEPHVKTVRLHEFKTASPSIRKIHIGRH